MLTRTALTASPSHPARIRAARGSDRRPVRPNGADLPVTADIARTSRGSSSPVLTRAGGDLEVPTGNPSARVQMSGEGRG